MNLPRPRLEGKARPGFMLNPKGQPGVIPGKMADLKARSCAAKKGAAK